ncbi:MAG TPA: hypothetical protein VH247_11490 [Thermoleophilaceae bacterium]|nr:hypothetical protein [Thermoleophilaceae bacterium]
MKRSLWLAFLASLAFAAPASAGCDNLDPAVCLQPFPNNYFTKADSRTGTGLRVNFKLTDMPRNAAGKPIQPGQWNRNDGFSPGSLITTYVPGLDLAKTHGVPINDLARTYDKDAAIVVIDAKTLERNLIWTEMDASASNDSVRNLIVRPGKNFREGHTYIVALRNLKDSGGSTIPAGDAFRGYRDGTTADARSDHMDWIFSRLKKAGVRRDKSLFLAWDFTVAGERNLSGRMLHIRDDAFAQLGDTNLKDLKIQGSAPEFKVSKVEASDGLARKVTGYFKVPCYISTPACQPGGGFVYKPGTNEPLQVPGNTYTAKFVCNIPDVALQTPGTASLYGHGLFGSTGELGQGQLKAFGREHDYVFCGTTWAGMGCELDTPPQDPQQFLTDLQAGGTDTPNCDIPNVVTAIGDLSRFNTMIDRVQEGMLAFLYLGRLMAHPQGLVTDPAFQNAQGQPVIKIGRTYYDGNSQGGIIGGSLAALMVDSDRASIGVPGMNYSTLLQRSTDFGRGSDDECTRVVNGDLPSYACLVYKAYPSEQDRQVVFALMQMLWDRGEADGYAWHMTGDPLPNTPRHHVLMSLAFGDHQVSNWAAAVEARTIGARLRTPALDTFRDPTTGYQYFGEIPAIPSYPYDGSAITVWDSGPIRDNCTNGTAAPLFVNLPVFGDCPAGEPQDEWGGHDPHEEPRNTVADRAMKAAFLREGGVVTDQCGGQPCHSRGWMGAQ